MRDTDLPSNTRNVVAVFRAVPTVGEEAQVRVSAPYALPNAQTSMRLRAQAKLWSYISEMSPVSTLKSAPGITERQPRAIVERRSR